MIRSRDFCTLSHKVQMSTSCFKDTPWILHNVINVPLLSSLRVVVFFVGNVGSLKTQISPKKTKTYVYGQKKKKTFVKGSTGTHSTRVQIFMVYLPKTAWALDSEGIWGDKLEPACRGSRYGATTREGRPVHPLSPGQLSPPCTTSTR